MRKEYILADRRVGRYWDYDRLGGGCIKGEERTE
jgi:hypothetical protein